MGRRRCPDCEAEDAGVRDRDVLGLAYICRFCGWWWTVEKKYPCSADPDVARAITINSWPKID